MPNGTYGGVRGRKMKVGGNDYIIFLLLDFHLIVAYMLNLDNKIVGKLIFNWLVIRDDMMFYPVD